MPAKKKRPRGRPRVYKMPPPIPDTPENVAQAIFNMPSKPDTEWDFLQPGSDAFYDEDEERPPPPDDEK